MDSLSGCLFTFSQSVLKLLFKTLYSNVELFKEQTSEKYNVTDLQNIYYSNSAIRYTS